MRQLPLVSLLALPLLLVACAAPPPPAAQTEGVGSSQIGSNARYERTLDAWLNRPEEDLVASWGVPERSQRLTDGGQALEYRRVAADGRLLCSTLFTSDVYGKLRTWAYRGLECREPKLGDYGSSQPLP